MSEENKPDIELLEKMKNLLNGITGLILLPAPYTNGYVVIEQDANLIRDMLKNHLCPNCEEYRPVEIYPTHSICNVCGADFADSKQMEISLQIEKYKTLLHKVLTETENGYRLKTLTRNEIKELEEKD